MYTHQTLLAQLIRFERPLAELLDELKRFDESEGDPAVLEYKEIASVLDRYLSGKLTVEDVYDWVSALELRDDIQFGQEDEHVFLVIFKLATPELEGPLTEGRARALLAALRMNEPTKEAFSHAYW